MISRRKKLSVTENLKSCRVVSNDAEIKTGFCLLKFGIICQLSVRTLRSKHDFYSSRTVVTPDGRHDDAFRYVATTVPL